MLPYFHLSSEVAHALRHKTPIVALESTVITHGLPYPDNLQLARDIEDDIRQAGVTPATIAVLEGKIHVGLQPEQLERLALEEGMRKLSVRDLSVAIARRESGGTTVAATLFAAHQAGLRVFATGGIGGVHRHPPYDVSADLPQLAKSPLVVVCAGAKAVLDLPATLEYLETLGVPVIGYQTDELPAFYSRSSGLKLQAAAESPEEVVAIAQAQWNAGMDTAILVCVPPPEEIALPAEAVEEAIQRALEEASQVGLRGPEITPFLLERVSELTEGSSLQANLGLLRNNAHLAARIAQALHASKGSHHL